MTDYGQSIPPKWVRDQTPRQMTKMGLASFLYRCLLQVGMVPIKSFGSLINLGDPANAEYPITTSRSDLRWFFDFPTSETWVIDGIPYRPVLSMYVGSYASAFAYNIGGGDIGSSFGLNIHYRRADRFVADDMMNRMRCYAVANNLGLGNHIDGANIGTAFGYGDERYGALYINKDWKMYEGSADSTRLVYVPINNVHVILGKGGLTIQVGSGVGKTDSNSIFSFSLVFGGARVPGRARIPINDPNLNRVASVFLMPHQANSGSYYTNVVGITGVTLYGEMPTFYLPGGQHDLTVARATVGGLNTRPGYVRAYAFNLENIERPFYPVAGVSTRSSPRTLISGSSHILQPIVYSTQHAGENASIYIGPVDPSIRPEPTPAWADVWYVPKLRFGDRNAPFGEQVDPTTGLKWFVFYSSGLDTMMATEVDGITKYTTPGYFTPDLYTVLNQDLYFNFILGGASFTWTSPASLTINQPAVYDLVWTTGVDEAKVTGAPNGNIMQAEFALTGILPVVDTVAKFQLELRWYSASAQADATQNPLYVEYYDDQVGWVTVQTIYNTGVSAIPYNAYTAIPEVVIPWRVLTSGGNLNFRLRTLFTSGTGGNYSLAVRNMHVRLYTRA